MGSGPSADEAGRSTRRRRRDGGPVGEVQPDGSGPDPSEIDAMPPKFDRK
ncbi:hypothetical protein CU044_5742 [Streptomyces sp. L-9-10]|nr:hypothetical protein CU044_5742 [Streptomyces sp. L-9-10]